jgi:hypothetical protein
MNKWVTAVVILILAVSLLTAQTKLTRKSEAEPNDYFKTATAMPENTLMQAMFSAATDVDVYKMNMSADSIYHIYSDSVSLPKSMHVEIFWNGDTTKNLFVGNPDGRAGWSNFRVAGWSPREKGSGVYYLRVTHASPITAPLTGAYLIRYISQGLQYWAGLHEPDDSFQESFAQFALPVDGTRFNGMLYNLADVPHGWDDRDIFYMVGEQGKRLWVETEPVQGYPHTRDMDSEIQIWDGDGNQKFMENDDKNDQEEDFGNNNVFSLTVMDSLPYSGLYYVTMTSVYAKWGGDPGSGNTDENPSTGGYIAYAWMGERSKEIEPNDTPAQATPMCEKVTSSRVGITNNFVINAKFSSDGDADWYAYNLKSTKMYFFTTFNNATLGANVNLEVYKADDLTKNYASSSVNGRYNNKNFRFCGWVPPVDGIYLLKVSPSAGTVAGTFTGEYQLRMGWATYRSVSLANEPANNTQSGAVEVKFDSSKTIGAVYPAGDDDWYKFEGKAGDIIDVELFSALDENGMVWARDLDTDMTLIDPSGASVDNDDYRPGATRHSGNVFSGVTGYVLQGTGTVYIRVGGGYDNWSNVGNNPTGVYRMVVYSSAASPAFKEKEKNDSIGLAMLLPEGKDVVAKFASASDIDCYKMELQAGRMYFVNSFANAVGVNIHAELFAASDTAKNVLDASVDGRYNSFNFRLSGFVPAKSETYYLKLTCPTPNVGDYNLHMRSSEIKEVATFHEPDNSRAQADALGDFPVDGVMHKTALYNSADPKFVDDLDVYRFTLTKGQAFTAKMSPVGGELWYRDTDSYMLMTNAKGDTISKNDDDSGTTFSKITLEVPADGVYYVYIMGYYSKWNGNRAATNRNPGVGDYLLTVSGLMSESEPNNAAAQANLIPISNSNLVEAKFATDDLVDWFKVNLEKGHWYYFNSADSKVGENIILEVYKASDPNTNIIDGTGTGRFSSKDFRLSGYNPPETGEYLLKLSIAVGGINDQNIGTYRLRAAGGELISEVAPLHEPDNGIKAAAKVAKLPTDGSLVKVAFSDSADADYFAIDGIQGQELVVTLSPGTGGRWIREIDTGMKLFTQDSTVLDDSDDYDDWYELNFYLGDVSCTYSQVKSAALPYTGTYYAAAMPYYGKAYGGGRTTLGNNATGSYYISATMRSTTGVAKDNSQNPEEFALSQNYPNPFNPTTTITYQLKETVPVTVGIYNVRGQLVANLVDKVQPAGTYSIHWNATDQFGQRVASGMYLYRIQAGDKFIQTKKMLLMK